MTPHWPQRPGEGDPPPDDLLAGPGTPAPAPPPPRSTPADTTVTGPAGGRPTPGPPPGYPPAETAVHAAPPSMPGQHPPAPPVPPPSRPPAQGVVPPGPPPVMPPGPPPPPTGPPPAGLPPAPTAAPPPPPAGGTAVYDAAELGSLGPAGRPRWVTAAAIAGFVGLLILAGGGSYWLGSENAGGYDTDLIASAEVDPERLTADELFAEELRLADRTLHRVETQDTDDCAVAAQGGFGEALAEHECAQVVRAAYLDEGEGTLVTLGAAAFPEAALAEAAQGERDLEAARWFAPLAADEGPAAELAAAPGYASGASLGRYLVFALATTAGEAERQQDLGAAARTHMLQSLGERAR